MVQVLAVVHVSVAIVCVLFGIATQALTSDADKLKLIHALAGMVGASLLLHSIAFVFFARYTV
jgi:hypothetical protein